MTRADLERIVQEIITKLARDVAIAVAERKPPPASDARAIARLVAERVSRDHPQALRPTA